MRPLPTSTLQPQHGAGGKKKKRDRAKVREEWVTRPITIHHSGGRREKKRRGAVKLPKEGIGEKGCPSASSSDKKEGKVEMGGGETPGALYPNRRTGKKRGRRGERWSSKKDTNTSHYRLGFFLSPFFRTKKK